MYLSFQIKEKVNSASVSKHKDVKYYEAGCICVPFPQVPSTGDPPTLSVPFPKTSVTHCLLADFNIILYNSTKISLERDLAIAPNSFLVDTETTASKLKISSRSVTVGTARQNTCYQKAPGEPLRDDSVHTHAGSSPQREWVTFLYIHLQIHLLHSSNQRNISVLLHQFTSPFT